MREQKKHSKPFDHQEVEDRTQAIGRELFGLAKAEHAKLSSVNRWTEQVLGWCLSDRSVKSRVLRLIDVLPSLSGPRAVAKHILEYFQDSDLKLPAALKLGADLARPGLITAPALSLVVRRLVEQVARQFIAELSGDGAANVVRLLAAQGATCSLDVLGEQVLSEREADAYAEHYLRLIREMAQAYEKLPVQHLPKTCGPLPNLSVKPSALTPRFFAISPAKTIERAAARLIPILRRAQEYGALVNLDMEQYEYRDLTLELAKHVLLNAQLSRHDEPGSGRRAALGVVIQAYLKDSEDVTESLLEWLETHERALTIRLVKGAYWDSQMALAQAQHWSVPVYEDKSQTDHAFERLTEKLLSAYPLVSTAIASHNIRSIAHAMAVAEVLDVPKDKIEFQLLYGMGEAIRGAIKSLGYSVRIYAPIGDLIPGMAYLVRRILENTANESFLRQDALRERTPEELLQFPMAQKTLPVEQADTPLTVEQRPGSDDFRPEPFLDWSEPKERAQMAAALSLVRGQLGARYPVLLGDRSSVTGAVAVSRNPSRPDEIIGHVVQAPVGDVDLAVRQALAAQADWAQTPVKERTACLRRAAEEIRRRRHELIAWEILEVGKTWREADADIAEAVEYLEYYSWQMEQLSAGKPVFQVPGERNLYRYQAKGVVAVIAPWNFPAAILTGMTSAALAAGNAVILKPAEQSSIVASHIAQIFRRTGIPSGVIQCLNGQGETVGSALVKHPGVNAILFTGSKAVGLSIVEAAARLASGQRHIKHVVAELGGKNALVIDDDADVDAAIAGALHAAFSYGGQKCSALSRLIIHTRIYDKVMQRLVESVDRLVVGDPADPDTDIGPLIEASAQQRLHDALSHAGEVGTVVYAYPEARLPAAGHFVGPAIAANIPVEDRLAKEELFGPLLCVFRTTSFEAGLELANRSDYALTGGVYTRSPAHIELAAKVFDVGNLYINRPTTGAIVGRQPFGGHRLSGLGTKAGGPDYLLQLLTPKTICVNTARHGTPLE